MSKVKGLVATLLAGSLVGGLLVGCGGSEEPKHTGDVPQAAAQRGADAKKPSQPAAPARPKSAATPGAGSTLAEQLRVEVDVPDEYPDDAPIYPGSQASSVRKQGSTVILGFGTMDSPAEVQSYIETDLGNEGWDVQETQEMPNGVLVVGSKGGRKISVLIAGVHGNSGDANTLIMVSADR